MKQFTKLTSALALVFAVAGTGLYSPVSFAETEAQKQQRIQERKDRRSQAVGERTGRAVTQAFELYQEEKLKEGLEVLKGARTGSDFDRAFVDRYIGQFYFMIGEDLQLALDYMVRAAKPDILSFSDQASLLETIAHLHAQKENHRESIDAYEAWMHFTGDEKPEVYLRIANAYYNLNQYDQVIAPANRAIALADEPREAYYQVKLAAYYDSQNMPEAVALLEEMVQIFPENAQWWFYLANTYMTQEMFEKALSSFRVANLLGYLETQVHYQTFGQMFANNYIPFKAADIFDKQMKAGVITETPQLLRATASNYQAAREYAKAAEFYGRLGQKENDAEAYRRQGEALLNIQRYRDAVAAFNKALELNVDNPGRVHMSLVNAHFYQEQYPQALAAVTQARRDSTFSRQARSWESYIREKAKQKGVDL